MKNTPRRRVSMQSVADAAGVARSTVSFVLNGKEKEGRISAEVAQRVRRVAKQMNYQVNELARSLRTGQSQTIALIVANISDPFFGRLTYCLQEYAEKESYTVIIFNTGENRERLTKIFTLLRQRRVDGIIMVPVANIEEGVIEDLRPDVPMVIIDRYFPKMRTSCVCIDNYGISTKATQLLIDKGCRKVLFVTFREKLMHMQDRKKGYADVLREHNLFDENLICEVDYFDYREEIKVVLQDAFKKNPDIDGVFISTGFLSPIVLKVLVGLGRKLQEDIQIISFGRTDLALGVSIPYIQQPLEEICKRSFNILMDLIKDPDDRVIEHILPAQIITDSE
ncbi:MAG: LacI family transcriptional regulator [Prevotellaceae bacterium]|jgi:LacI family transcriptional regulator|nr:LacI family transcriptional regulator [Prevotellaceae bacterium]